MTDKIVSILAILTAVVVSAQAEQSPPKPIMADAVQVVKIISTNRAKIATYCKLAALSDQFEKASNDGDNGRLQQPGKRSDALRKGALNSCG